MLCDYSCLAFKLAVKNSFSQKIFTFYPWEDMYDEDENALTNNLHSAKNTVNQVLFEGDFKTEEKHSNC